MNRNKKTEIDAISKILANENNAGRIKNFLVEMLTEAELETLSKRWRIVEMLNDGTTQREIAQKLRVSLCKVTRGAKILKDEKSTIAKYITKENKK